MRSKVKSNFSINFFKDTLGAQILLALVVVIIFILLGWSYKATQDDMQATLILNLEEERMFQGEVIDNMSMLDALNASVLAGDIKFDYEYGKDGEISIIRIDGHSRGDEEVFKFYLNSLEIDSKSIHSTMIKPKDIIEVRLIN